MTFSTSLLPEHGTSPPVLYWLSRLTCSGENFTTKAGTQHTAAELGIASVTPDASSRGDEIANDGGYDLGQNAGFYLNATETPQAAYYRMYDYLRDELPALIRSGFSAGECCAISGHPMGGHGALVMTLKNPGCYISASAFAPIVNPGQVPWGRKMFTTYLSVDESTWQSRDSCALVQANQPADAVPTLIDRDDNDPFLVGQLQPVVLAETVRQKTRPLILRTQPDYDHSYYFIASFIEGHLRFRAQYPFA